MAGWGNKVSRKECKLDRQPVVNSINLIPSCTVLLKAVVNILQSCLVK